MFPYSSLIVASRLQKAKWGHVLTFRHKDRGYGKFSEWDGHSPRE